MKIFQIFYQKKDDEDAHLDFEISFFRCSESVRLPVPDFYF